MRCYLDPYLSLVKTILRTLLDDFLYAPSALILTSLVLVIVQTRKASTIHDESSLSKSYIISEIPSPPEEALILTICRVACIMACPREANFTGSSLTENNVFNITCKDCGRKDTAFSTEDNS